MLEMIREYGVQQLAAGEEESPLRDRHAAHFLDLAERGETGLTGPDQAAWMARLEGEYGNLRAALGWAIGRGDAPSSLRMGSALWRFWSASGRLNEGRDWLDRALALDPDDRSAARAQALMRRGNIAVDLADYPAARRFYEESVSICRTLEDEIKACRALDGLGLVQLIQGNYAAARAAHRSTLKVWRSHRSKREEALVLHSLGNIAVAGGNFSAARDALSASLTIRRELDDAGGVAYAIYWRGRLDRLEGKNEAARIWLTRILAEFRELGDQLGSAFALNELGCLAHDFGDDSAALPLHFGALLERVDAGALLEIVECLEGIAAIAVAQRWLEPGVMLHAATAAWRHQHGAPLIPALKNKYELDLTYLRSELPPAIFERAWGVGAIATLDEAVDLAFALHT